MSIEKIKEAIRNIQIELDNTSKSEWPTIETLMRRVWTAIREGSEQGDEAAMAGMWKLMTDSKAAIMDLKFFKKKGDSFPDRLIVFVDGQEDCQAVIEAVRRIRDGCDEASLKYDIGELSKAKPNGLLVKLVYFKASGKYYSSGSYITEKKELFEIWQEVRDMKQHPGLVNRWNNEGPISVDVPLHSHNHPHLIVY